MAYLPLGRHKNNSPKRVNGGWLPVTSLVTYKEASTGCDEGLRMSSSWSVPKS